MRWLSFVALGVAACGGSVSPTAGANPGADGGTDSGDARSGVDGQSVAEGSSDGSLPAFCSGPSARMVANGTASNPAVTGKVVAMNCCDSAELTVVTQTFQSPIVVWWRSQVPSLGSSATTIDLATPPSGWAVEVDIGCDPSTGCSPPDRYASGLTGTLSVARAGSGYQMTLCLAASEQPASPHPILHSLELYAPDVVAN